MGLDRKFEEYLLFVAILVNLRTLKLNAYFTTRLLLEFGSVNRRGSNNEEEWHCHCLLRSTVSFFFVPELAIVCLPTYLNNFEIRHRRLCEFDGVSKEDGQAEAKGDDCAGEGRSHR